MTSSAPSACCQVRVGVRIRPVTSQEIKQGGKQVLDVTTIPPCIGIGERRFTYDAIFGSHVGQQELYDNVSKPLLSSFLDGYNATIMAYGQTGSGKTFTMGSEAHSESESTSHAGLIPRFLAEIFDQLQRQKELGMFKTTNMEKSDNNKNQSVLVDYKVSASFLEVYGEDVHDLLDRDRQSLPLREDSSGGIVIAGLTTRPVGNATAALEVLNEGTMNRTTAATLMNLTSSRSHAVFTIKLSQTTQSGNEGDVDITTESQFTFVDLAGSERMKKTGAEGERAREGIKINEGLLALGNVINALADDNRLTKEKKVHVPYRQSKLTRLLQDALGGNSQTLFLACVSPSDTNASETLSTLHYANRARNIKNAPTKNVDSNILELQRLNGLTRVLQCELIKLRFKNGGFTGTGNDNMEEDDQKIGEMDKSLLERSDVQEYINHLYEAASQNQASYLAILPPRALTSLPPSAPSVSNMDFSSPVRPRNSARSVTAFDATPSVNQSVLDRFDDTILDEVDPDAEMAMLDQLLEVQQQVKHFGQEEKKGKEELDIVEGELAQTEVMLLQLKESLKVYHNLKEKYEILMTEVKQLEDEKEQLADQLEKAKADPSTGCSASIKKKLENVEQSLTRARNETRKHRQMYRKAEQEAQKCKTLERKITELKQGRVALIKKQKDAAARHKEITDSRMREIMALRRKERIQDKQVSKLQSEIHIHKNNLEKRKQYSNKLAQKLQQTESHLMKMLSMRNREFRERTSTIGFGGSRRRSSIFQPTKFDPTEGEDKFAPLNEEVKSMKFVLEKMVSDKVARFQTQRRYEECMDEYSEAMRAMSAEFKKHEEARKKVKELDTEEHRINERECEENVEELEIKVELLGNELEDLRCKLPQEDEETESDDINVVETLLAAQDAPVLRTLLLQNMETYTRAELERRRFETSIQRKDCALESLESEVESLSSKVAGMTQELTRRRRMSGEDALQMVSALEKEKIKLRQELEDALARLATASSKAESLKSADDKLHEECAVVKENLSLSKAILRQNDGVHPSEGFLEKSQRLWEEMGVDLTYRDAARKQIDSCLEDTCTRILVENSSWKEEVSAGIREVELEIRRMQRALGQMETMSEGGQLSMKLLQRLSWLKAECSKLQPIYSSAIERRSKLERDAAELTASMMVPKESLSEELLMLLKAPDSDDKLKDLSDGFLSKCEEEVSSLRLRKARILVQNTDSKNETHRLAQEMNLSEEDIVHLSVHSIKQRLQGMPRWWDQATVKQVINCVIQGNGVVPASVTFSQHIEVIRKSLSSVAKGRRQLSTVLRDIVNRAQRTLLETVEGEIDASEAYASFHEALFRLPPLSKEFVEACISEIEALVAGVESMSQSEVEALTVVWEALDVSMNDRGEFWSEIDDSTKAMENSTVSPFDEVLHTCAADKEQWVLAAVKNCRSTYKQLETRLFKLESIHKAVEKMKLRQNNKSRIISMDSELRVLSARLSDFEDKKCNKQRLLSKKSDNGALLKEERFRKQMQAKYSATLEQLSALLKKWEADEGEKFDPNLLSDEICALLKNSNEGENWVEKRTAYMHLRMTQGSAKRKERPSRLSPPRKRLPPMNPLLRSSNFTPASASNTTTTTSRAQTLTTGSPATSKPRPLQSNSTTKKRKASENPKAVTLANKHRKVAPTISSTSSPLSPKKALSPKKVLHIKKRESTTLLPFGNVLSGIPEKENSS